MLKYRRPIFPSFNFHFDKFDFGGLATSWFLQIFNTYRVFRVYDKLWTYTYSCWHKNWYTRSQSKHNNNKWSKSNKSSLKLRFQIISISYYVVNTKMWNAKLLVEIYLNFLINIKVSFQLNRFGLHIPKSRFSRVTCKLPKYKTCLI